LTRIGASAKIEVFSEGYARNHQGDREDDASFFVVRVAVRLVRGGRGIE
jgi:hypothetical protein